MTKRFYKKIVKIAMVTIHDNDNDNSNDNNNDNDNVNNNDDNKNSWKQDINTNSTDLKGGLAVKKLKQ